MEQRKELQVTIEGSEPTEGPTLIEQLRRMSMGLPLPADKTQEEREVEVFLAQFDSMGPEERRRAMATVFGVDPARAAVVRRPDGKLEMREVSLEARAQIERLGRQGFSAVSFTNRKQKRGAAALARRKPERRSASAR